MILSLFAFLFAVSFSLIIIGLWREQHSELVLIGFLFLFLLSFTLINSQLQIKSGETTSTEYTYDNSSVLVYENAVMNYDYDEYGSHNLGYWIAVSSMIGFIITLVSLRRTNWGRQE